MMPANTFTPTEIETRLVDEISRHAFRGERAEAAQKLARYRELLIRPLIGRVCQGEDKGLESPALTRRDAIDAILRARGGE